MKLNLGGNIWFLIISLLFIFAGFYFFTDIIVYVLIAFIFSLMGQPFMRLFLDKLRLSRWRIGNPLAAILTILIFLIVFGLIIALFIPVVGQQAVFFSSLDYKAISETLDQPLQYIENYLTQFGIPVEPQSSELFIREFIADMYASGRIGNLFGTLVNAATGILMGVFSVLFILFFFLQDRGMFINFIATLVPSEHESRVVNVMNDTIRLLTRYFTGLFIQAIINTTYVSIFLSVLGVRNALLIGFIAGITNVIPYLGPLIGAGIGVMITLSGYPGMDFYDVVLPIIIRVIIVIGTMQLLDNFITQPVIFSNSVKAHPLEIFLVILIASQLGGVMGMILAIPVYTMLRVVAKNFLSEYKIVQRLTQGIG